MDVLWNILSSTCSQVIILATLGENMRTQNVQRHEHPSSRINVIVVPTSTCTYMYLKVSQEFNLELPNLKKNGVSLHSCAN